MIRDSLAGHDLLVQSPTGSGKTLAFGIPLVERLQPQAATGALVLAPTRELAGQIVDDIRPIAATQNLKIAAVYGGVGFGPQIKAARQADILVATPGRLEDLIARGVVSLEEIRILVLDEADRMLDMGFKPAVDRIVSRTPRDRQTLFFSATLEGATGKLAAAYTHDARTHTHAPKQAKADIEHHFLPVETQGEKLDHLVAQLRDGESGPTIVFVRTKRGADRLVKRLRARKVEAVAMHGDKSQRQRERALARFEDGEVAALVATDVAARGIDVEGITHVINYDAPEDSRRLHPPHRPHRPRRSQRHRRQLRPRRPGGRRPAHGRRLGLVREFEVSHGSRAETAQLATRAARTPARSRSQEPELVMTPAVGSVEAGIALALVGAVIANLGCAAEAPRLPAGAAVRIQAPLQSARRLAGSPWFAAGWGVAAVAWLVHVAALSMAPISLVQAALAAGAVSLAVLSQRLFGHRVEPRQWLALLLGGVGLALLALTLPSIHGSHSQFAPVAIVAFEGGLAALALALALGYRQQLLAARHGALLAVIAGTLFAFAGVAIKALTGEGGISPVALAPWVGAIVVCGALAQYAAVAALQRGGAIETIGLMGLVASGSQILSGVIVFGDPLASGSVGLGLQATAFVLVCISALLLPPSQASAPQRPLIGRLA